MALRYTVQYADPTGPHPLAHDAAWALFSTYDDAAAALADVAEAGRRIDGAGMPRLHRYDAGPYAVRILDGADVIMTDVPGSVLDADELTEARELIDLIDEDRNDYFYASQAWMVWQERAKSLARIVSKLVDPR